MIGACFNTGKAMVPVLEQIMTSLENLGCSRKVEMGDFRNMIDLPPSPYRVCCVRNSTVFLKNEPCLYERRDQCEIKRAA